MKYLLIKIGSEFAFKLEDILHIYKIDEVKPMNYEKPLVGKITVENEDFVVIDIKDRIDKTNNVNLNVIVFKCKYKEEVHFELKETFIPIGITVDGISKIIEAEEHTLDGGGQVIKVENEIYSLLDVSKYIKEIDLIKEKMAEMKKIRNKESNKVYMNDSYFKAKQKNKMIDIWQKKHSETK